MTFFNRIWNRLRALWGGFFWLPCPICGKNFGGHEWAATLKDTAFRGRGVCPQCVDECNRRNEARKEEFAAQERWWYGVLNEVSKSMREGSSEGQIQ